MSLILNKEYISPVHRNGERSVTKCLESELLYLANSSDVNDPDELQFSLAQQALRERHAALEAGWDGSSAGANTDKALKYLSLCHQITINHLAMRKARFGSEQCAPFEELCNDGDSNRDIFLVIKFMDEEQHIASTIYSLLSQKGLELNRVVIVGVDNMSSDESSAIFKRIQSDNTTPIKMIYCQQKTSGGGSAARLGVDRCIATVARNTDRTGDFSLLHRARISVSDGDTVYHPSLVADSTEIFDTHHNIDGVMPFLTYKLTACLRLFENYQQKDASQLLAQVASQTDRFVISNTDLDTINATEEYPRGSRSVSDEGVTLGDKAGNELFVPYIDQTPDGIRYGVLIDRSGNRALIFEDRHLVVEKAPVSGYDNVLVHLENGEVRPSEIWRWHSLTPLALIFGNAGSTYQGAFNIVASVATINGVLIQMIMASRVLYGLASQGNLPKQLTYVHPTTHTPLATTALVVTIILCLALFLPMTQLAEATSIIVLAVFMIVNLALVRLKLSNGSEQNDVFEVPIWVPVVGFLSSLLLLLSGLL